MEKSENKTQNSNLTYKSVRERIIEWNNERLEKNCLPYSTLDSNDIANNLNLQKDYVTTCLCRMVTKKEIERSNLRGFFKIPLIKLEENKPKVLKNVQLNLLMEKVISSNLEQSLERGLKILTKDIELGVKLRFSRGYLTNIWDSSDIVKYTQDILEFLSQNIPNFKELIEKYK